MSISYNKAVLQGRLTADLELQTTASGISYVQFMLAVDRHYQKEKERKTDFIRFVAWRQQAEFLCQYAKKGYSLLVEGSIQIRTFEKDGAKMERYNVVVDNVKIDFPPKATMVSMSSDDSAMPVTSDKPVYLPEGDDDDLPF